MNLFILSLCFRECAESMFDKHVHKIILEAVQMLCTAKHLIDPDDPSLSNFPIYKIAHKNHPVSIWVRASLENYLWTISLVEAMHDEWKYRYNHPSDKEHKSFSIAMYLKKYAPSLEKFPERGLTPFALAMPDEYKTNDPIESYRNYYQSKDKQLVASWKKREMPTWYKIDKWWMKYIKSI